MTTHPKFHPLSEAECRQAIAELGVALSNIDYIEQPEVVTYDDLIATHHQALLDEYLGG